MPFHLNNTPTDITHKYVNKNALRHGNNCSTGSTLFIPNQAPAVKKKRPTKQLEGVPKQNHNTPTKSTLNNLPHRTATYTNGENNDKIIKSRRNQRGKFIGAQPSIRQNHINQSQLVKSTICLFCPDMSEGTKVSPKK